MRHLAEATSGAMDEGRRSRRASQQQQRRGCCTWSLHDDSSIKLTGLFVQLRGSFACKPVCPRWKSRDTMEQKYSTRLGWYGGATSNSGCGLCPSRARGDTAMILLRCFKAHVILVFMEMWKRCCLRELGSLCVESSNERVAPKSEARGSGLKTPTT